MAISKMSVIVLGLFMCSCTSKTNQREPASLNPSTEPLAGAREEAAKYETCESKRSFYEFYVEKSGKKALYPDDLVFPKDYVLNFDSGKHFSILPGKQYSDVMEGKWMKCRLIDSGEVEIDKKTFEPKDIVPNSKAPKNVITPQGLVVNKPRNVKFKKIDSGVYQIAKGDYKPLIYMDFGFIQGRPITLVCQGKLTKDVKGNEIPAMLWHDADDLEDIYQGLDELFGLCIPKVQEVELRNKPPIGKKKSVL